MSSGVASTLRRPELANGGSAAGSTNEPPRRSSGPALVARARARFSKLVSSAFSRYLLAFLLGAAAMSVWQTYGNAARTTVASWSPHHLAWLAPGTVSRGITHNQIRATSVALAAVHQSVAKLATEIDRLEAQGTFEAAASSPPRRRRRADDR